MANVIANTKLKDEFGVGTTHMVLVDSSLSAKDARNMTNELEKVDGVKYVLGLESVVGSLVPEEVLPESITSVLKNDKCLSTLSTKQPQILWQSRLTS